MTLKVPKGAVSMREGTIVEWKVASGDSVALGQHIYNIETEKTTLEVECPFEGTITILEEAGTALPVGHPIALIQT